MSDSRGVFITFEGGEGAGKTTQVRMLSERLGALGREVIVTREPGGTPEAEKIRDLLVRRDGGAWDALEECLLIVAARASHVRRVIAPALAAGRVVICDRFIDSTLAYQGYAQGMPLETIRKIHALAIGSLEPQMTFLLDIDPVAGLARSGRRLEDQGSQEDRFERRGVAFHEALRQGFLEISRENPVRVCVLDAAEAPEILADTIRLRVEHFLDGDAA